MIGDGEALGFRQLLLEAVHDLAGSPKGERDVEPSKKLSTTMP